MGVFYPSMINTQIVGEAFLKGKPCNWTITWMLGTLFKSQQDDTAIELYEQHVKHSRDNYRFLLELICSNPSAFLSIYTRSPSNVMHRALVEYRASRSYGYVDPLVQAGFESVLNAVRNPESARKEFEAFWAKASKEFPTTLPSVGTLWNSGDKVINRELLRDIIVAMSSNRDVGRAHLVLFQSVNQLLLASFDRSKATKTEAYYFRLYCDLFGFYERFYQIKNKTGVITYFNYAKTICPDLTEQAFVRKYGTLGTRPSFGVGAAGSFSNQPCTKGFVSRSLATSVGGHNGFSHEELHKLGSWLMPKC